MKATFLGILLLWVSGGTAEAQGIPCGTPQPAGLPYELATENDGITSLTNEPWVEILVKYHIIRLSNGTDGLNPNNLAAITAGLNNAFDIAKFTFTASASHFIDSDALFNKSSWSEQDLDDLAATHNVPVHINIYFIPQLGGSVSTFTLEYQDEFSEPMNRPHRSVSIKLSDALTGASDVSSEAIAPLVTHEVGHYFNLFHTFECTMGDGNPSCPESESSADDGDLIADTFPEPDVEIMGTGSVYQGSSILKDFITTSPLPPPLNLCQSGDYRPIRSLLETYNSRNYMTYNMTALHMDTFTPEQALRIRNQWSLYMRGELGGERVIVTNTNINDEQNVGGSYSVTDESVSGIASGVPHVFTLAQTHILKTDAERLSSLKHFNWNDNLSNFQLGYSMAQPAAEVLVRHRAYFKSLSAAELRAQLIEGGNGQIGMRDPWYLHSDGTQPNTFLSFTSPYTVTGAYDQQSGGVFLNQGDPNNLVPPYYSVRAAETQTVNGQGWVFWKWDTSGVTLTSPSNFVSGYYESPAIFRNWGTRTVTATYKAHLASNTSDVMTAGGQRRLVVGDGSYPNIDHMLVYGSAGSIWASYKTSSGAWGNEVCISGSGSNHATPSASWGGTYLPVVWRSGSSGNYSVLFNKRTSGSWLASLVTVASGVSSDPAPQIAFRTLSGSMTRRPHVAYRTSNTGLTMRWSTDDGSSWSNSSSFSDNDGIGAYSLSAVNTLDDYNAILTLAYVSNMLAYVRDFQGSWGSRVLVPASVGENYVGGGFEPMMTDTQYPQVVRHDFSDRTVVAFDLYQEYFDGDWQWLTKYYRVVQTRDEQGEWGTATAFEASWPGTPSLSLVNGKFTMLWDDAGTLTTSQESQGTWGEPSSVGSGAEPALAVSSGTSTSSAHYAWRENASGLYKIVPSSSQMSRTHAPQQPAKRTSEDWVYRRVITMIDTVTGGVFSVTASLPSVAGRLAPLTSVNDTLPGINAMNFFSFVEPVPFTAESGDSLAYELTFATNRWPKDAGFVSVQAGIEAARLTQSVAERSIDLTRKSQPLRLQVPLEASSGSPVRLALEGSLPEWADRCVFTLTHVYSKPEKQGAAVEPATTEAVEEAASEALSVYPNPFNPETKVGYRMKEGGWVKVSVYDLLGREVAVLVDGWMPAGTHSAIWNARDLPSGTYICRLVAQESGKSVVKTVKMQYVR